MHAHKGESKAELNTVQVRVNNHHWEILLNLFKYDHKHLRLK